ncbi:hypothetical protein QBC35DRAFT_29920 [Podospora australis]|uniref:Uncharacterized protein n=1 Tax=Podospora australis TaxID=1536484 RepID=A0AAN6WPH9_9PEZI|nr:hypothetical protein QBC35DRAFT_29920 [Podospora australis]
MDVEFKPNKTSITSESAPLIEPVDSASDQDLFMVPLKRPSPKLPSSRFRNVKPRTPPRSPVKASEEHVTTAMATKASTTTPPMSFTSPLMSPEGTNSGTPNLGSLVYHSPPMSSIRNMKSPSSGAMMMSPEPTTHSSPNLSAGDVPTTTVTQSAQSSPRAQQSTKASSVYDTPADDDKLNAKELKATREAPPIPPRYRPHNLNLTKQNLGLALQLNDKLDPHPLQDPNLLAPPLDANWNVPDSPMERLSQMRATPDSAYDRARQMEIRRSEWKHIVYRFPVKGSGHWVIDCDLTESSHARLSDVASRSSEGFEWNGDYELANIYRVLALAHRKVMEEMRAERVAALRKGQVPHGLGVTAGNKEGTQAAVAVAA